MHLSVARSNFKMDEYSVRSINTRNPVSVCVCDAVQKSIECLFAIHCSVANLTDRKGKPCMDQRKLYLYLSLWFSKASRLFYHHVLLWWILLGGIFFSLNQTVMLLALHYLELDAFWDDNLTVVCFLSLFCTGLLMRWQGQGQEEATYGVAHCCIIIKLLIKELTDTRRSQMHLNFDTGVLDKRTDDFTNVYHHSKIWTFDELQWHTWDNLKLILEVTLKPAKASEQFDQSRAFRTFMWYSCLT